MLSRVETCPADNWLVYGGRLGKMNGVSRFCELVFVGWIAVWLAGCQTTSEQSIQPSMSVTTTSLPAPLTVAPPAPLSAPPVQGQANSENSPGLDVGPSPELRPPVSHPWPANWINAWVPLESWGKFNGLPRPMTLSGGKEPLYQLQSSNGLVLVKIGSQSVNMGGIQVGLGFAPRLIKGFPYIHSLDARKTLQALAGSLYRIPHTNRLIVIDPGHGGRDSGALSCIGHDHEKHFTLDWAKRLQPLLLARGWNVILTRTNDTELTLADRIAIADRVKADLFLSLHFNSGLPNRDLTGLETYCLTPTGMPSNLIRDDEDDVHQAHPNNLFDEQNVQLASRLHRSLLGSTGAMDRGVRRARFMAVLRGQNRPAVLIEGGYLSNTGEARRIASVDYRQALAEGIARALD